MRRLAQIVIAALIAMPVCAGLQAHYKEIVLGTNTSGTATYAGSGYVEAVHVAVSDGASTGSVQVAYAPLIGGTAVVLATNDVADEAVFRPRVDATDNTGNALTGDDPVRYPLAGETVTLTVSGSPTNKTWKMVLILDEN